MTRATVATFGRERKSLRSASLSTKKVVDEENSSKIVDKENSASAINRRGSRTPGPSRREPVRQVLTPSPVKKGRATSTTSGKTSRTSTKSSTSSPIKALATVIHKSQPSTPKKKLAFDEQPCPIVQNVSPKKVLADVQNSPKKSPAKPATPVLYRPDVSRFASARRALSVALPDTLVGRQSQLKDMKAFLDANLAQSMKKKSRSKKSQTEATVKKSLYVSGPPGTGKTTCLKHLISNLPSEISDQLNCVFINCMALGSSEKVFSKFAEAILPASKLGLVGNYNETKKLLEDEIVSSKKLILLVLDEIDQLESKCQEVLYTLFEWPYLNNSKLVLVGIANALDLTDRILPRISLRASVSPEEINFPAYSREEISKIISTRLHEFNSDKDLPIIKPAAITFLAAKISTLSGDVRKALGVCRRAIELAELEARKQTLLKPLSNTASPNIGRANLSIKPIDVPQILKIVNEVYCSSVTSSMGQNNSDLPLHQKLIIASLLLMTNHGKKSKEVTMGKLHETYTKVCKKRGMTSASLSEAVSMAQSLESRGFLSLRSAKESKDGKLSLRIDDDEIEAAMQDKTLLSGILHDIDCISK